MKRIIVVVAIFFSIAVTPAHAQELSPALRVALFEQLQELLQQVVLLQAQMGKLQPSVQGVTISQNSLYPTDFYSGNYESAYSVKNLRLHPLLTVEVRPGDKALFDVFIELVGGSFVSNYIQEFRIYNNEDSQLGAYVQQKKDGSWILAVNRYDEDLVEQYDHQAFTELLLHEFAHILFFEENTIAEDFEDTFWNSTLMRNQQKSLGQTNDIEKILSLNELFYKAHAHMFVSEYAASAPEEDLTESFTFFVHTTKPANNTTADSKVRFFYKYPQLESLRTELRESGILRL